MTKSNTAASKSSRLPAARAKTGERYCRSCGATKDLGRRKYCSRKCRQRLVWKLDVAASLLRALHTRYATFSFTSDILIVNVVASGANDVFSFLWKRTPGRKPAEDLGDLVEYLGDRWWKEHGKKGSRRQAALSVLENARTSVTTPERVKPQSFSNPIVSTKNLSMLKLTKKELLSNEASEKVKSAYRKQVFIHHPDKDGDARQFRKVHQAYEELRDWLEDPIVRDKKGLPDKWSFNGNKWSPPLTAGQG